MWILTKSLIKPIFVKYIKEYEHNIYSIRILNTSTDNPCELHSAIRIFGESLSPDEPNNIDILYLKN